MSLHIARIGVGAFGVSFIALRDLMLAIGYSAATAWAFPAIIDTAVAVATVMLVALGDKPARRTGTVTPSSDTQTLMMRRWARRATRSTRAEAPPLATTNARAQAARHSRAQGSASAQPDPAQMLQSAQTKTAQADADLASDLIASGATTQSVDTVIAVLSSHRDGASINAAAKASGINYRTAQRIVEAAEERRQARLVVVG
jgi:Protein of unknown function (DUF2637)